MVDPSFKIGHSGAVLIFSAKSDWLVRKGARSLRFNLGMFEMSKRFQTFHDHSCSSYVLINIGLLEFYYQIQVIMIPDTVR